MTRRSNQKWTPVMGETLIFSRLAREASLCFTLCGSSSASAGVGNGKDVGVGGFFAAFVKANSGEFAIFDFQPRTGARRNYFPTAALDFGFAAVVKIGERHGGAPMR